MKKYKHIITITILVILIYIINKYNIFNGFSPTDIKNYVVSFGVYAPLIYIMLFAIVPLTFFPDSILAIASGMIFGLAGGFVYTMIGALCGASLAYLLARYFGRTLLKNFFKNKMDIIDSRVKGNGFMIIFLLRLIPLFPFDVISYSAGLSDIKYKDFILATSIGTIPGIFVFTNIGDKSLEIGSNDFYVSLSLLVVLLVGSVFLRKKISFKHAK